MGGTGKGHAVKEGDDFHPNAGLHLVRLKVDGKPVGDCLHWCTWLHAQITHRCMYTLTDRQTGGKPKT